MKNENVQQTNITNHQLDASQQAAANDGSTSLAIIAPAGSGKTTVIVERIKHLISTGTDPRSIVAISFTNTAVNEMTARLAREHITNVYTSTIHGIALEILSTETPPENSGKWLISKRYGRFIPAICEDTTAVIRAVMRRGKKLYPHAGWSLKSTTATITAWENTGTEPCEPVTSWVITEYTRRLDETGFTSIAGVIRKATEALQNGEAETEWIKAVLVDEAQDLNPVQAQFIEALGTQSVTAVGDPLQSIYGFQAASPEWLQGLENTVELQTCYRSTKAIVNAANKLTGRHTTTPTGTPHGTAVTGYAADDELDEAQHVTRQINEYLAAGVHGYDIMLLTRTHAQQKQIRRALAEERIVGVQVKTVHEAKGQEAEVVLVTGLCEQVWNPEGNDAAVLRDLYTAVTRARSILHITWASQTLINGQVKPVERLKLLEKLPVEWGRELTTRDEVERHLAEYATLDETAKENLAERKHATDRIASLWGKAGEPKKQGAMESCGSLVTYEHYVSDDHPDKDRWALTHGVFCNLRTCPMCNWRRSVRNRLRLQAVVNEAFKRNREEHQDRNDKKHLRNPLFLTVTIPSVKGEDLKTAVHNLLKTWRRMTKNPNRTPLWRDGLVGYWRSLEITRNPQTGLYHPHLHVLFLATTAYYIDPTQPKHHSTLYRTHEAWGTAWTQAYNKTTGDSQTKLIVDARAVQGEELEKAVAEVTKYVTKDDTLLKAGLPDAELTERLLTLETGIRGVKLVDQGGEIQRIMETANMDELIKQLIEQGENWTKVSESDWTYLTREYYETARRDEPKPEKETYADQIPF